LIGAKTWTLQKTGAVMPRKFGIWCSRRMEKISCTDHVRNEEVLHKVKEEMNILHTIKRRKGRSDCKTRKNTSVATGQP
jgi:hypothetical protein